jgi:GTP pyrophosphokinase
VLSLPYGATPIDFAYAVHSGIGDRCRGAKVNGQIVPLSTPLENGQRVEILTAKQGGPSLNWLLDGWVKSNKATSKIRAYIRQQNADATRETGKNLFEKQIARINGKPNWQNLAEALGFDKIDDLYLALGQGDISPQAVGRYIQKQMTPEPVPITADKIVKQSRAKTSKNAVLIDGEDGLLTVLAKCCKPAPPAQIIGFVTKGRGISVHRQNCDGFEYLAEEHPEKVVAASWADKTDGSIFPIDIEVRAHDRNGLLRDVSDLFSRNKLNVIAVQTLSKDLVASMRFTVEVQQVHDLPRVLAALTDIKGVMAVTRL